MDAYFKFKLAEDIIGGIIAAVIILVIVINDLRR